MPRKYANFERTEMADGTYIVAEPQESNRSRVRLQADWFDGDEDDEADFEPVVAAIVEEMLQQGGGSLVDDDGTLSREDAKKAILDNGNQIDVQEEDRAEALIDYFNDEGVFDIENDQISLLMELDAIDDIDDSEVKRKRVLNWAAAFDAGENLITNALTAFEESKGKLEDYMEGIEIDTESGGESSQKEIARQMMQLGDGDGYPDRSSLSSHEKEKYDLLKQRYLMAEESGGPKTEVIEKVKGTIELMGTRIEILEDAKSNYEQLNTAMRVRAYHESTKMSGIDDDLISGIMDISSVLTGGMSVSDISEDTSDEELEEMMISEFDEDELQQETEESREFVDRTEEAVDELGVGTQVNSD
ncbi:MAG: hypothetical protein ABEJ22_01730 [Haloferacaceae archaeon]